MQQAEAARRAVAVVGVGAILPDAPDAPTFWENVKQGRSSITEVDPSRWDPALYYDPDPQAPDKTYSIIGGWCRNWEWEPLKWRLPIPPKVSEAIDDTQKWAVKCTREALLDYGWPGKAVESERTAVVFGNALGGGEHHYLTSTRAQSPEFVQQLVEASAFQSLPADTQKSLLEQVREGINRRFPTITEDTMPGELSNCIAGRVANLFDFKGPNFTADAACASAMGAMASAIKGLVDEDYDVVVTGGLDRNMGASTFIKFCKIGALSATGSRPYADGADGFVMGEGASVFVLKRLADAERDGDRIYAVIRCIAGSSDGKGKGIAAPNPVGQKLAVKWAWERAGVSPGTVSLVEGHGTSTKVGDVVELDAMGEVFAGAGATPGSIALGSVKSNIGHLKASAGSTGILKVVYALHEKLLPPSINFHQPNPNADFTKLPLWVNTELREWELPSCGIRRAGASAFGFGGTNFHAVLEEYVPGRITAEVRG